MAQVDLDSTGKAIGFGSLPYPGDNAVGAPGALTGATGVPVPAYPFYARADHPTQPTSEVKDPAGNYDLSAKAEQGKAEGRAALRAGAAEPPVSTVVAQASGHIDASGATMTAVSRSEGLNFGNGLLRIATTQQAASVPRRLAERVGARVRGRQVMVNVDPSRCVRFGFCEHEAPEIFQLRGDGRLTYRPTVPDRQVEQVLQAARVCPARAIVLSRAATTMVMSGEQS